MNVVAKPVSIELSSTAMSSLITYRGELELAILRRQKCSVGAIELQNGESTIAAPTTWTNDRDVCATSVS